MMMMDETMNAVNGGDVENGGGEAPRKRPARAVAPSRAKMAASAYGTTAEEIDPNHSCGATDSEEEGLMVQSRKRAKARDVDPDVAAEDVLEDDDDDDDDDEYDCYVDETGNWSSKPPEYVAAEQRAADALGLASRTALARAISAVAWLNKVCGTPGATLTTKVRVALDGATIASVNQQDRAIGEAVALHVAPLIDLPDLTAAALLGPLCEWRGGTLRNALENLRTVFAVAIGVQAIEMCHSARINGVPQRQRLEKALMRIFNGDENVVHVRLQAADAQGQFPPIDEAVTESMRDMANKINACQPTQRLKAVFRLLSGFRISCPAVLPRAIWRQSTRNTSLYDKTKPKGICQTMVNHGVIMVELLLYVHNVPGSHVAKALGWDTDSGLSSDLEWLRRNYPVAAMPHKDPRNPETWSAPFRTHIFVLPDSRGVMSAIYREMKNPHTRFGRAVKACDDARTKDGKKQNLFWITSAFQRGHQNTGSLQWHPLGQRGKGCPGALERWLVCDNLSPNDYDTKKDEMRERADMADALCPDFKLTDAEPAARPGVMRVCVTFDAPPIMTIGHGREAADIDGWYDAMPLRMDANEHAAKQAARETTSHLKAGQRRKLNEEEERKVSRAMRRARRERAKHPLKRWRAKHPPVSQLWQDKGRAWLAASLDSAATASAAEA